MFHHPITVSLNKLQTFAGEQGQFTSCDPPLLSWMIFYVPPNLFIVVDTKLLRQSLATSCKSSCPAADNMNS